MLSLCFEISYKYNVLMFVRVLCVFRPVIVIDDFPDIARASSLKGTGRQLAGSTQRKIMTDKVALSVQASQDQQKNSVKHPETVSLFVYFKLYVYTLSGSRQSPNWFQS